MPIVAMTREMGSLGTSIGLEAARQLGYEFLRQEIVRAVAERYRVGEASVIRAVEEVPGILDRLRRRRWRQRAFLEAAVLEAALRDRVVLMGRWSTVFLRGVGHAVRVRVCAPPEVRAGRVAARHRLSLAEARRRVTAHDEAVRYRMRQAFDLEWRDPLLYDLVINTERVSPATAVRHLVTVAGAPEFQATPDSRASLGERALAASVRAHLKASPATTGLDLDVRAAGGRVVVAGVVGAVEEREAALAIAREVPGVAGVESEIQVFRRPVR
jgi:cytidylate kinase